MIRTHGLTKSREYRIYCLMKGRCRNPNTPGYKNYGGRGIKVCDRWINSFENFLADIGNSPSNEYSLDRINNDGNYEPGNCRWATRKQQTNNKRGNSIIEHNGIKLTVAQWAEKLNMNPDLIYRRLYRGWTATQSLTEQKGKHINKSFGKDHWLSKVVIQKSGTNTVAVYESTGDASRKTGLNRGSIKAACTGRLKTYKGYTWEYS